MSFLKGLHPKSNSLATMRVPYAVIRIETTNKTEPSKISMK